MMNESDTTRKWRQLFDGQNVSPQLLAKAEFLVNELPMESPLRLRYATQIGELRQMNQPASQKKNR